jgi:K+ transporter
LHPERAQPRWRRGTRATLRCVRRPPTAPIAAGTLIVAYAVAVGTGSRLLGGVVLAIGGLWCIWAWLQRHGRGTATVLGCVGFAAFVLSHVLALAIGAWPSVLVAAVVVAVVTWTQADARPIGVSAV